MESCGIILAIVLSLGLFAYYFGNVIGSGIIRWIDRRK